MGQIIRVTISHAIEGVKVISDPEGWQQAVYGLERNEFHSLTEYYKTTHTLYGDNGTEDGGRDWVKNIEKLYGPDSLIEALVEISIDDQPYETLFEGQLPIESMVEILDDDHTLQMTFDPKSFWTTFKSRYDTPVDIQSATTLDGGVATVVTPYNITLSPQQIKQEYAGYVSHAIPVGFFGADGGDDLPYLTLDFDTQDIDEINIRHDYSVLSSKEIPFEKFFLEHDGNYRIQCTVCLYEPDGAGTVPGSSTEFVKVFFQVNGNPAIEFTATDRSIPTSFVDNSGSTISYPFVANVTDYTLDITLNLKSGDSLRIYGFAYNVSSPISFFMLMARFGRDKYGFGRFQTVPFQGYWDASIALFPSTSSTGGGITSGMTWFITTPGILGGTAVDTDWVITALINTPGQTRANWYVNALGIAEGCFNFGDSFLNILAGTTFKATVAPALLIHDIIASIIERTTGVANSFLSNFMGRTNTLARTYDLNGCGSPFVNIKGLQLRNYTLSEKPASMSAKDFWECWNPILNLGLGFKNISGIDTIVIEEKISFYDSTNVSVQLSNVSKIKKSYDQTFIYNKITTGYGVGKGKDASSIDDYQDTIWATALKNIGSPLDIISKGIAAGLTLEEARRTTRKQSANYQYDNNDFIVKVVEDGLTFKPETTEGYNAITNLLYSDSRYNKNITPARNLRRWLNVISIGLQNILSSAIKFVSGEGNYDMVINRTDSCSPFSDVDVDEKGDVLPSSDYLFLPIAYEIDHYLTYAQLRAIKEHPEYAIEISQTSSDYKKFFIKTLEFEQFTGNLKLVAYPKEFFDIQLVKNVPTEKEPNNDIFDSTF